MSSLYKSQFIHRLTGADFHPRRRVWLLPLLGALAVVVGMCLGWK